MTQQTHTITYHSEKESGYQWKLRVEDDFGHMTVHFADQKSAEQYVIVSRLQFGEIV